MRDVLRAEVIAHHYEIARQKGLRRREDAENHRLLGETLRKHPEAGDSRRSLLQHWGELKWAGTFAHTEASRVIEFGLRIPTILTATAFVFGIIINLSWSALESSVHVPSVLFTHALLPFFLMLVSLSFGNYFGNGENLAAVLKQWGLRLRRKGRQVDDAIREKGQHNNSAEGSKPFITPLLHGYIGLFSMVERFLHQLGTDPEMEEEEKPDQMDFRIHFSDILKKRSVLLRLWCYLNLQLMLVGYFVGFFVVFLYSLLLKSAAFHWGTSFQSLISAERMENIVSFISTPWRWFAGSPSLEQIAATRISFGEKPALATAGWEAWAVFLMMAIACYAILPRLLLCLIQKLRLRQRLARDTFAEQRFQIIIDGMRHPPGIYQDPPSPDEQIDIREAFNPAQLSSRPHNRERFCLFITDELLWQDQDLSLARETALRQMHCTPQDTHRTLSLNASVLSTGQFQETIQTCIDPWKPLHNSDRIVFLVDSGQSPKSNAKTRVRSVREVAGQAVGILFLMVHEEADLPDEESVSCRIWNQAIRQWGDPNILVADLKPTDHQGKGTP